MRRRAGTNETYRGGHFVSDVNVEPLRRSPETNHIECRLQLKRKKKKRHFWVDSANSINKGREFGTQEAHGVKGWRWQETPECVGVGRSACDRPSALDAQEAAGLGREIWRRVGAVDLGVALAAGWAT